MSAEMTPDTIQDTDDRQPLEAVPQETQAEGDKRYAELMDRVRKLDRQNTDLRKDLERKDSGSRTMEERLAIIEGEREEANNRARTVEAFADAGLGESWRRVFEEKDPYKRAEDVRTLLKAHESDVAQRLATELGTAGAPDKGPSGKPQYTMEELANMSEAEINKAFNDGRVQGM